MLWSEEWIFIDPDSGHRFEIKTMFWTYVKILKVNKTKYFRLRQYDSKFIALIKQPEGRSLKDCLKTAWRLLEDPECQNDED